MSEKLRPRLDGRLALAMAAVALVITARSLAFLAFEGLHFDADQAVQGLMAKHIAEGRAFPIFTYGQRYILALSAWLSAPLVWLLGPRVFVIKLVPLAFNLVAASLALWLLRRDAGLSRRFAVLALLPLALPGVVTTSRLTECAGGNVEPFAVILILWMVRRQPVAFGLLAAVGFLNREFVAYGVVSILLCEALAGQLQRRAELRRWLLAGLVFTAAVLALRLGAPDFGLDPHLRWKGWERVAIRWHALTTRFLPVLVGFGHPRMVDFGIVSRLWVTPDLTVAGATLFGVYALRVFYLVGSQKAWRRAAHLFPIFLVATGALTLAGYLAFGRGDAAGPFIRYVLLALYLAVGLLALGAQLERRVYIRRLVTTCVVAWALWCAFGHARLVHERLSHPLPDRFRILAEHLEGRGVTLGMAEFSTAYPITYLSGERVRLAARGLNRIPEYLWDYEAYPEKAVRILEPPCEGGVTVAGWCVIGPPAE
jgi:hypothetical protein